MARHTRQCRKSTSGRHRFRAPRTELPQSRSFPAPTGWSGRFWARTGCKFDRSGSGSFQTGDCGSGQLECNGARAAPPTTLAEFTLGTSGGSDYYDVSLVDGYNVAMIVEVSGGSGLCATTGCVSDLNRVYPSELWVDSGLGCKSACETFGSPEYCCSGPYNTPATCKPSLYSQMFKAACPRSYSYAYDDPTSTFTCAGADYTMTFCPSLPRNLLGTCLLLQQPPPLSPMLTLTLPKTAVTNPYLDRLQNPDMGTLHSQGQGWTQNQTRDPVQYPGPDQELKPLRLMNHG